MSALSDAEARLQAAVTEANEALAALDRKGMSDDEWNKAAKRYADARSEFLKADRHHTNLLSFVANKAIVKEQKEREEEGGRK